MIEVRYLTDRSKHLATPFDHESRASAGVPQELIEHALDPPGIIGTQRPG
jgi:hypothetical protein